MTLFYTQITGNWVAYLEQEVAQEQDDLRNFVQSL